MVAGHGHYRDGPTPLPKRRRPLGGSTRAGRRACALVLLVAILIGLPIWPVPGPRCQDVERHHIIIVIDRSESMSDNLWNRARLPLSTTLQTFVGEKLPEELRRPGPPFSEPIWRPDIDRVSVYLAALPLERPSFERSFLEPICEFQSNFSFEWLGAQLRNEVLAKRFDGHWSAVSCQIPFALRAAGSRAPSDLSFVRTYAIRISDEQFNGEKANRSELYQLRRRHLSSYPDLPRSQLIRDFDYADNIFRDIGRDFLLDHPSVTKSLMWDARRLRHRPEGRTIDEDRDFVGLTAYITEVLPIQRRQFDYVFAPKSVELARRLPTGEYRLDLHLSLAEDFASRLGELEPWGLRVAPVFLDAAGSDSLGETVTRALTPGRVDTFSLGVYRASEFGRRIKAVRATGLFRRGDSSNPSQVVAYGKDIRVLPEPTSRILGFLPVMRWMLAITPRLSQQHVAVLWQGVLFALFGLAIFLYLLAFVPEIALRAPRCSGSERVTIDFSSLGKSPVLVSSLEVVDTSKKRRWIQRRGRLEDVTVSPEDDEDTQRFELPAGNPGFVRLLTHPTGGEGPARLRAGDSLPLTLIPSALSDYRTDEFDELDASYSFKIAYRAQNGGFLGWTAPRRVAPRETQTISIPITVRPAWPEIEWEIVPLEHEVHHSRGELVHCGTLRVRDLTELRFCREAEIDFVLYLREKGALGRGFPEGSIVPKPRESMLHGARVINVSEEGRAHSVRIAVTRETKGRDIEIPLCVNCADGYVTDPVGDGVDLIVVGGASSEIARLSPRNQGMCEVILKRDPTVADLLLRACLPAPRGEEPEVILGPADLDPSGSAHIDLETICGPFRIPAAKDRGASGKYRLFELQMGNAARTGEGYVTASLRYDRGGFLGSCKGVKAASIVKALLIRETGWKQDRHVGEFDFENEVFSPGEPRTLVFLLDPTEVRFKRSEPVGSFTVPFDITYSVRESPDSGAIERAARLHCTIAVQKDLGNDFLAVDFGTSALAVAFAEGKRYIQQPRERSFDAMLPLASRLKHGEQWAHGGSGSRGHLLPTRLYVQETGPEQDHRLSVSLPGPEWREPDAAPGDWVRGYLKKAIVRNPDEAPLRIELLHKPHGSTAPEPIRVVPSMQDVVIGAYRTLFDQYVQPLLSSAGTWGKLRRVVLTHPNSFLVEQKALIRRWVKAASDRLGVPPLVLSESDAITYWYVSNDDREHPPQEERVLTYDIGAGTLDISLRRIERHSGEVIDVALEHLYTRPGAGDELDVALARYIDGVLEGLVRTTEGLRYDEKLFGPVPDAIASSPYYFARLMDFKAQLTSLKIAYSEAMVASEGAVEDQRLEFRLFQLDGHSILVSEKAVGHEYFPGLTADERPAEFGSGHAILRLPLVEVEEIVQEFLRKTVDRVLEQALGDLLESRGVDTVVISGRTSAIHGFKERVERVLRRYAGPAGLNVVSYDVEEAKESVVLGALKWATDWRTRIQEAAPPPIYGSYGVVYDCGQGAKWLPFFGPGSDPDKEISHLGEKIPVFYHEERIPLKGLRYVKFRYSLCPNPGSHVDDPNDVTFWGVLDPDTKLGSDLRATARGGTAHVTASIEVGKAEGDGSPAITTKAYVGPITTEDVEPGTGTEVSWRDEAWPMTQFVGRSSGEDRAVPEPPRREGVERSVSEAEIGADERSGRATADEEAPSEAEAAGHRATPTEGEGEKEEASREGGPDWREEVFSWESESEPEPEDDDG